MKSVPFLSLDGRQEPEEESLFDRTFTFSFLSGSSENLPRYNSRSTVSIHVEASPGLSAWNDGFSSGLSRLDSGGVDTKAAAGAATAVCGGGGVTGGRDMAAGATGVSRPYRGDEDDEPTEAELARAADALLGSPTCPIPVGPVAPAAAAAPTGGTQTASTEAEAAAAATGTRNGGDDEPDQAELDLAADALLGYDTWKVPDGPVTPAAAAAVDSNGSTPIFGWTPPSGRGATSTSRLARMLSAGRGRARDCDNDDWAGESRSSGVGGNACDRGSVGRGGGGGADGLEAGGGGEVSGVSGGSIHPKPERRATTVSIQVRFSTGMQPMTLCIYFTMFCCVAHAQHAPKCIAFLMAYLLI